MIIASAYVNTHGENKLVVQHFVNAVKVYMALTKKEMDVHEISITFQIPRTTVYRMLDSMVKANLLVVYQKKRDDLHIVNYYRVNTGTIWI